MFMTCRSPAKARTTGSADARAGHRGGRSGGHWHGLCKALGQAGMRLAICAATGRIHARAAELIAESNDMTAHIADLTEADQAARLADAVGGCNMLQERAS